MANYSVSDTGKTEFLYFKGKGKWMRHLFQPDVYMGASRWNMVLYPTPESLELFREIQLDGVKNRLKKDEDGYNFQLSRPTEKKFRNVLQSLTPPVVEDAEGKPILEPIVGNGSDVTVKCETYWHNVPGAGNKKARAIRLAAVRVDNLVPFEKDNDYTEGEHQMMEGMDKQSPSF